MIDLGNCFPQVSYRLVDRLHAKNMSDKPKFKQNRASNYPVYSLMSHFIHVMTCLEMLLLTCMSKIHIQFLNLNG